ncbi:MAG: penicillin-binding protein 2, partial [Bacteroidales bacterium]|nr:penicillin-binding protein 2 [Bacteroidales bacterium]
MAASHNRRTLVAAAIILVFAVIAFRLFHVQILDKGYRVTAENNALKYETIYPARGRILDRNGEVIVDNKLSYDIMVTPYDVKEFDTLAFCRIFDLDTAMVKEKFREYRLYRSRIGYQSLVFKRQVTSEQYNMFIEKSFLFPGFTGVPRTQRAYPYEGGGNLFGYISEVDAGYIKEHPEYKSGDYVGKTGMEEAY